MTATVTVVDYGVGNLLSVRRAFEHRGAQVQVTSSPDRVWNADRLVLPGVGAFGDCVAALRADGMDQAVRRFIASGRPFLGICVGMQVLFDVSEEFGEHAGLGVIPGRVRMIPRTAADGSPHKVPHIGWTALRPPAGADASRWSGTALAGVRPGDEAYFVHSFTGWPEEDEDRLADADYHGRLVSAAVRRDNVCGVQFHPEKSGRVGLSIIDGFLRL